VPRRCQRFASTLLVGLSLVGCNRSDLIQRFTSADDQTSARSYIEQLRHQQFDKIEAAMDPSLAGPSLEQTLRQMANLFPAGEPSSVTLVGAQSFTGPKGSTINLTYEFSLANKWLLTNVALKKQHGNVTIIGFHGYPESRSLEAQNKFRLGGKTPLQYAVLALTAVVPLFTLWVLVLCARTRLKGRKWPWVVFIPLGVGKLAVNWTTGAWGFALAYVQLLGASAFAPLYGPWTLAVSVPLGAIVFLMVRNRLRVSVPGQLTTVGGAREPPA
jgi:hypothetical protein